MELVENKSVTSTLTNSKVTTSTVINNLKNNKESNTDEKTLISKLNVNITDVAVAVTGSVDSGKSTFVGVMFSGELDDGNGLARNKVARHHHEITTGKTSDISTRTVKCSNGRLITLIDLCGHEKYLKTTSYGITGHYPDYAFVVVAANRGILKMTKEHLGILFNLQIPIIFVITRVDITPENIYNNTVENIKLICRKFHKKADFVSNYKNFSLSKEEILKLESNVIEKNIPEMANKLNQTSDYIPIFTVSNKTGYFINPIRELISHFKARKLWDCTNVDGSIFYIDTVFNPKGIGLVLSGITKGKTIKVGDNLYIGPKDNQFFAVKVRSIHNNNKTFIDELGDHQRGCIALTSLDKNIELSRKTIEKGMLVISSLKLTSNVCFKFNAKVEILHHSATINNNYSPVIHVGPVRQCARLVDIKEIISRKDLSNQQDKKTNNNISEKQSGLATGDKAIVTFKFKYKPEFIEAGATFFFREGTTRGMGIVDSIYPLSEDNVSKPDPVRSKKRKFKRQRKQPVMNLYNLNSSLNNKNESKK